jgi:predicted phosphoribosyltransferase
MYSWMGQLFMEKDWRAELADAAQSAKYEIVNAVRQNIARKRSQIHRLRAELEIEELQRKEKALRQRRKLLEEELKVKERQIAVVDLDITTGQRRMETLKRVITGEAPYAEAPAFPSVPDFFVPRPPESA